MPHLAVLTKETAVEKNSSNIAERIIFESIFTKYAVQMWWYSNEEWLTILLMRFFPTLEPTVYHINDFFSGKPWMMFITCII